MQGWVIVNRSGRVASSVLFTTQHEALDALTGWRTEWPSDYIGHRVAKGFIAPLPPGPVVGALDLSEVAE